MFASFIAIFIALVGVAAASTATPTTVTLEFFQKGTNCSVPTGGRSTHKLGVCEGQNMYTLQAYNQVWNQIYTPSVNMCGVFSGENDCYWIGICQSGYYAHTDDEIFVTVA